VEYMRKLKRLIKLRRYRKTNLRKEKAYEPVQLSRRPQKRKPRRRKSCRRRRRRQRSDAAGERARRRGRAGRLRTKTNLEQLDVNSAVNDNLFCAFYAREESFILG
jgi:hypothetical protein